VEKTHFKQIIGFHVIKKERLSPNY